MYLKKKLHPKWRDFCFSLKSSIQMCMKEGKQESGCYIRDKKGEDRVKTVSLIPKRELSSSEKIKGNKFVPDSSLTFLI